MDVTVVASGEKDIAQRIALVSPDVATALGVVDGDTIVVRGDDETVLSIRTDADVPDGSIQLGELGRRNAGLASKATASVEAVTVPTASQITLRPTGDVGVTLTGESEAARNVIEGHPIAPGDTVSVTAFGQSVVVTYTVVTAQPDGPVLVTGETAVTVASSEPDSITRSVTPSDLGGVDDVLSTLQASLIAPLTERQTATALGATPDGTLLLGQAGSGRTSIARSLGAIDPDVSILYVAPQGQYHDGRVDVRAVRRAATERAPVVVVFDDLDVLAPADTDSEAAALARLVTELVETDRISVLGTATDAQSVSAPLRRGGALSHRVRIPQPDHHARREMLAVQFADVTLDGVDLDQVAEWTRGFVAADIAALASDAIRRAFVRYAGSTGTPAVRMRDVDAARTHVVPSGLEGYTVDQPSVSYRDIGGLTDIKRELVRSVEWPLVYPDLFERVHGDSPAGVLLYGPPGTGKTMLAKAVATSSDANFIAVNGPELFDRYVGESEKAVREVFERARQSAPTVVFLDEVDALAASRDEDGSADATDRVVSQLLTELDGIEPSEGVIPIGATNRPDIVDRALLRPGRFERVLEVPLPDRSARAEIFEVHLDALPLVGDVDITALAAETEGYSGSDIAAVVREAGLLAMEQALHSNDFNADAAAEELSVTADDLQRAIREVDPSVSESMRETYAAYGADLH